jgi:6-pyruvoyltetrahydropterin/6-carboxytetrahydropterin synthase
MYTIRKKFTFSASHQLYHLRKDHPCSRLHGHNYEVEVVLQSLTLSKPEEWILDYRDLDKFKIWLDNTLDHRHLNNVFPDIQTTAENLAEYLFRYCRSRWPEVCAVRVSETSKTWAEYSL